MSISSDALFLGGLELPVNPFMAESAVEYAGRLAHSLSFDKTETLGIKLAVEEAFRNAVAQFPGKTGETERIRVEFSLEGSSLAVAVRDRGIPLSPEQAHRFAAHERADGQPSAMHEFMDSVDMRDLGRDGREVRLVKHGRAVVAPEELTEAQPAEKRRRTTVGNPVIRLARRADDMIEVCRLAWRCYGFTHEELLYDPRTMAEMITRGELDSVIAVDPGSGNIIGHICLKHHVPGDRVPEMSLAFVDPAYRSPGMPRAIADRLLDKARADGAQGFFDCSVTTHIHSQRGLHALGSRPCCLMLGITPTGMQTRALATSKQEKGSTVNHYYAFDKSPGTIHVPERHQAMVREIYGWLDVPRTFGTPGPARSVETPPVSVVRLPDALNVAFIVVHAVGRGTADQVADALNELRRERRDAVYAFLPACDEAAAGLAEQCEWLGFFFSGIMPHIHDGGDRILMQFVDIPLDFDAIRVYSDMSRALLEYIREDRQRVLSQSCP